MSDKLSNFKHIIGFEELKTGDSRADRFNSLFNTLKCNYCDWRVTYPVQGDDKELLVNQDYLRAICEMRDHIHNEHCTRHVPASKEVL